jgi:hypothetical protein
METPWQVTKNPCMKQMMVSFEIWGKNDRGSERKKGTGSQICNASCNVHLQHYEDE